MKKIIAVILLAASLGGCAQFGQKLDNIGSAITLGTATITNPVTKTRLNQIESSVTLVFAGLNGWRQSCVQGIIPQTCLNQIAAVQVYTRQIPGYLAELRRFVRNNDQINAIRVFDELTNVIGLVKANAAANGVRVGA